MHEILRMARDERAARIALAVTTRDTPRETTWAHVARSGAMNVLRFAVGPDETRSREIAEWQASLRAGLNLRAIASVVRAADRLQVRTLIPGDTHWPTGLSDLAGRAPLLLWTRGNQSLLAAGLQHTHAIVGARASSDYGQQAARTLARDLARRHQVVVSGGATGIDSAAHTGALEASGPTIAVLAGGLDRLDPAHNRRLYQQIIDHGLIVSEQPPGTVPRRNLFLARNRLVAALAGTTVVVEAQARSGTMHTAGQAARLGRPVGAVPGPITATTSSGPNQLLRDQAARAVLDANDIVNLTRHPRHPSRAPAPAPDRSRDHSMPPPSW